MTTYLCDWTHWQGRVCPAESIEREGFGGVKLKAGGRADDWSFVDPTFHGSAAAVFATDLLPMAYWFLGHGKPIAQAGLFVDLLRETNAYMLGAVDGWGAILDVEADGLTAFDVNNFLRAWISITNDFPITVYTNASLWEKCTGTSLPMYRVTARLEEAHWVSADIREDRTRPFASQHARGIDASWWNVNYGGWKTPILMQFTNCALVDKDHPDGGRKVPASIFRGSKAELRRAMM